MPQLQGMCRVPINPDLISIQPSPVAIPYKDIYDRDTEGPVVCLGTFLEGYTGELYIKVEHLKYIAQEHLGMVTKEDYEIIRHDRDETDDRNIQLIGELDKLENGFEETFNATLDRRLDAYLLSKLSKSELRPVPVTGNGSAETPAKPGRAISKAKPDTDFLEVS